MRDRTADLLRAKQALSQLSYGPNEVVGLSRLELPTSPLSGVRSNHLSYRPILTGLFSLLLRCSLAYSVMYYLYTPSFARCAPRTKQNILR